MERSIYYSLGIICGIAATIVFCICMKKIIRKMGGKFGGCRMMKETAFDERQLLARGQAYKYAFFTLMAYVAIAGLLNEASNVSFLMSFGGMWIGVCIAIGVFAITCILKDAYMNLYENAKGVIMMFSVIGLVDVALGLRVFLHKGSLLENGVVSLDSTNLVVGILVLVIVVVFIGRVIYNNKQLEEDEE